MDIYGVIQSFTFFWLNLYLSQHLDFCLTYLHLLCVKLDRFYRLLVFEMCSQYVCFCLFCENYTGYSFRLVTNF